MRITGSCGIRLACPSCLLARHRLSPAIALVSCDVPPVPPRCHRSCASDDVGCCRPALVPSGGSPLSPACLISPPCLDASPRYLITRAWMRAVSLCVPLLMPLPAALSMSCRPIASRLSAPPHRHDGRGRYNGVAAALDLLTCPFGSPSHPCGSASDGDGVRRLPR